MAVEIKFLIDGVDRGQPNNANEFGFTISEEPDIKTRVISFNNDLVFSGGAYKYFFDILVSNGICNLSNVEVQYQCGGVWKRLVDGFFIISEIIFDYDKCSCKTKMYDTSFSTKINNNKDIIFSLNSLVTKNLIPKTATPKVDVMFFNPLDCVRNEDDLIGSIRVYDAFQSLVEMMSDGTVDFDSNYFRYVFQFLKTFENFVLTTGKAIADKSTTVDVNISFKQLFTALDTKLCLGIGFERQANGRPLMRIEPSEYFYQQNADVNLYDQPNITVNADRNQLYATIGIGSSETLQFNECDEGNTPCTFVQTPVLGFEDNTFGFLGTCNTGTKLDIVSNQVIVDTNIIEDAYRFNSNQYETNPFLISIKYTFFPPFGGNPAYVQYEALKDDPYNAGGCYYNIKLNNLASSFNWRNELHNSISQYQEPYTPASTNFDVDVLAIQSMEIGVEPFTFFERNGNFIEFPTEITDVGNNFELTRYVIPRAGNYTFFARIFAQPVGVVNVISQAMIIRYDVDDQMALEVFGSTTTTTGISDNQVSYSGIFNQGEIVRVDLLAKTIFEDNKTLNILNSSPFNMTNFNGSGTPFENQFQTVDPNASRKILYNFERPLSMEEIESIINNTSKPILFGRFDDPLRVIKGYINKLDVRSIIEKQSNITLKSNIVLR
jgi:hypothetical protein